MHYPTNLTYPRERDASITTFRIFLCILPGFILAAGIAVAWRIANLWPLAIFPIPLLVMLIGYFEGQLALQQQQINPSIQRERLIRWSVLFLIMQIVIAPIISLAVIFGYAIISSLWLP